MQGSLSANASSVKARIKKSAT